MFILVSQHVPVLVSEIPQDKHNRGSKKRTAVEWNTVEFSPEADSGVELDVLLGRDTIYQPLRSGRIWHKVNF